MTPELFPQGDQSAVKVPFIDLDALEAEMLAMPQAETPVVHHFGPGIYVREVTLPAGIIAIGHAQKFEHLNIMLTGAVAMLDENNQVHFLRAPLIFTGKPGRKVGYVLETCVWQNIFATEERDIPTLEAMFFDKSDNFPKLDSANLKNLFQGEPA